MISRRAAIAVIVLSCAALARADDPWTLVSSDFDSIAVMPKAIDGNGVSFVTADGKAQSLPLNKIVELARGGVATPTGLVLCVADGQRLVGKPQRIDGPNLIWSTDRVGEIPVPLENALAVLRNRTNAEGLIDVRSEDQVKLNTGDSVKGILTEATGDAFVFTPAAGDPVRVTPGAVASILFATPPSGRPSVVPAAFLVRVGGSTIGCTAVRLDGQKLTLSGVGGADVTVALADVQAIEHAGGPVAWLSARVPAESTQTPYFGNPLPARFDTTVDGRPIAFGGRTYAHGIGVHSRSKLVYGVLPGDRTLRLRYAIDGALPRADVDVRVSVDGKVVHEAKGFKAGVLSPVVEASLADAKTITLEVDYGGGYDVQDRLDWIEPAVVRDTK